MFFHVFIVITITWKEEHLFLIIHATKDLLTKPFYSNCILFTLNYTNGGVAKSGSLAANFDLAFESLASLRQNYTNGGVAKSGYSVTLIWLSYESEWMMTNKLLSGLRKGRVFKSRHRHFLKFQNISQIICSIITLTLSKRPIRMRIQNWSATK